MFAHGAKENFSHHCVEGPLIGPKADVPHAAFQFRLCPSSDTRGRRTQNLETCLILGAVNFAACETLLQDVKRCTFLAMFAHVPAMRQHHHSHAGDHNGPGEEMRGKTLDNSILHMTPSPSNTLTY